MSKKHGIWGSGLLLSGMLDWCKRTAGKYWRFTSGIRSRSRMVGPKDTFGVARPGNASETVRIDFVTGLVEFKKFAEVMPIGDRIRAFCDDGVLEAEKISPTRFKVIYAVETTRSIQ